MQRRSVLTAAAAGLTALAVGAAALPSNAPTRAIASSHREAPLISNDPTADLTDLYAFPSPDAPGTVTLIANVIPIEVPAEGPNYYNLDDTARYNIKIDNNGDGKPELTFTLRTTTTNTNPATFLYAGGQVSSAHDPNLFVQQTWKVWLRHGTGQATLIGGGETAPNNVGKRVFPGDTYASVANSAITTLHYQGNDIKAFVGPREDPFSIDVGRIFDLLGVGGTGTDNLKGVNVHSIAIQVPASLLRRSTDDPVIGVWASVDRQTFGTSYVRRHGRLVKKHTHSWHQVERLGQPLINEVVIPRGMKDYWNSVGPDQDAQFEKYYTKPELVPLLNQIVVQPILDGALGCGACTSALAQTDNRADLSAILLRGFKYPNTGTAALDLTFHAAAQKQRPVDELRLNTAVAATSSATVDRRGLLCNFASPAPYDGYDDPACAGQFDGYPNGRRLGDDSTDIAIAALIGLPIDNLIPAGIQRPYALLTMGSTHLPTSGSTLSLLHDGADGVLHNDANGGIFAGGFPFVLPPNAGNPAS